MGPHLCVAMNTLSIVDTLRIGGWEVPQSAFVRPARPSAGKLTLVDLTDLVVDLPIVGLGPCPDALCHAAPTKAVFTTRQTRVAATCPKADGSGCDTLWS